MSSPAARTVYTHCKICEVRCGIEVTVEDNRVVHVAPDKQNPYTWRDFCAKARTAPELIEHPRRILAPMRRMPGGNYVEATWDEAIADIAARLRAILDRDGPDAIGNYWGNPIGWSDSNPLFMSGFLDALGTHSRYNVSSVDQNNFMVVSQGMYGSPLFWLIPDVDECRCFLFVGMNPAESAFVWISSVPDGWKRVLRAQAAGADMIVVDPRRTPTAEKADTHVAIRPGTDWAFLLGVLKVVLENGWEHAEDCAEATGMAEVRRLAAEADLAHLSAVCDVPADVIADVARRFATAPSAMCVTRTGVAHSVTGTVGEWLGNVLNLVTGRLDRPGGRFFQPGFVDVVGVYDKFAAPLEGVTRVRGLPAVAGGHSLAELPDEITTPGPGQIKAMIINCGNPVVSGPDGHALDAAFSELELLVVMDLVQRESHRHAHWLLPVAHWMERDDLLWVFAGGQDAPFVQYGRRAVDPPPGVREEWRVLLDLALAMKVPMFGKPGVNSFVKASRLVARATGRPGAAFGPRWLSRLMVASGRKLKWKDIMAHPHGLLYGRKENGHVRRNLKTPDGRVQLAPPAILAEAHRLLTTMLPAAPAGYPLQMITRRRKDSMNSWLNDLPGLHKSTGKQNVVEVHPDDAGRLGVATGDLVALSSPIARIELPAVVSDAVRPGVVAVEHGWGSRVFDPVGGAEPISYGANRNLLVSNTEIDPLSQTPALNTTWVRLDPCPAGGEPAGVAAAGKTV